MIVSTTAHPLFPLVARELFDEALYYRLNITLLRLEPTNDPELLPAQYMPPLVPPADIASF